MPIRSENQWLYPIDWPQLSSTIRFRRAGGRCEGCGRPHGKVVCHLGDGRWWDEAEQHWRSGRGRPLKSKRPVTLPRIRTTFVVLACAHLDHDPANNRSGNLRAYCQRCHIIHDRAEHLRQRRITYRLRKASGDLFFGPYVRTASPKSLLLAPNGHVT